MEDCNEVNGILLGWREMVRMEASENKIIKNIDKDSYAMMK